MIGTQNIGDSALVTTRVVTTIPRRLVQAQGTNNSGVAVYVQLHDSATVPAGGGVPVHSIPVAIGAAWLHAPFIPQDWTALTIVYSSTLASYTAIGGTPGTIQAILIA